MHRRYESPDDTIKIFWERESLKDIPKTQADIEWPENVEHTLLILERGRFVKNYELKREVPDELRAERDNKRYDKAAKKRRELFYVNKAKEEQSKLGEKAPKSLQNREGGYVPYKSYAKRK